MANMAQPFGWLFIGGKRLGVKSSARTSAPLGGVFTATQGLKTAWNSPLDERGIVGAALGLAWAGFRPVAEIQFVDYIFNTIDMLKLCGNSMWASGGRFKTPMVLMTPTGSGIHGSIYHSHSFDSIATKIHGMKVVCPSTPLDAYGLMLSAIKDDNPVLYLKPKALLRSRGAELIPGEPADEKELRSMIDARSATGRAGSLGPTSRNTSCRWAGEIWAGADARSSHGRMAPIALVWPESRTAGRRRRRGHRPAILDPL